jgi:hypothetical protein
MKNWPNPADSICDTLKITQTNNGYIAQFRIAYRLAGTDRGSADIIWF